MTTDGIDLIKLYKPTRIMNLTPPNTELKSAEEEEKRIRYIEYKALLIAVQIAQEKFNHRSIGSLQRLAAEAVAKAILTRANEILKGEK